jgi:transposase InsO family protein
MNGLNDRSRRPHTSPHRTDSQTEEAVIGVRNEHPVWGGRKIRKRLELQRHQHLPSPSTITAILHRHGCISPEESLHHTAWQRFEAPHPNALWQMDFKGHFPLLDTTRCHPLTVLDDHSRFALGLFACQRETRDIVQSHLTALFRMYGLPYCISCDNGPPWGTCGNGRYTKLTVWLIRLGIRVSHSRPAHPQTNGKDERFHRTLTAELLNATQFCSTDDCQQRFDHWRTMYNCERPHEALELAVPASRYQPSIRPFPEYLPSIEYNSSDSVRKVQEKGKISFQNHLFILGKAFAGYPVAVRPTLVDGVFDVFFCTERIAQITLNEHVLGHQLGESDDA